MPPPMLRHDLGRLGLSGASLLLRNRRMGHWKITEEEVSILDKGMSRYQHISCSVTEHLKAKYHGKC